MKYIIVFVSCLLYLISASYLPHQVINNPFYINTGLSDQYRSQDNLGNYAFGYNENHGSGGTFRRESGNSYGTKVGSYGLRDADGRVRVVNYVADASGFRVAVASNEHGLTPQLHQAATIKKPSVIVSKSIVPAIVSTIDAAPLAHINQISAASYQYLTHEPLISSYSSLVGHIQTEPIAVRSVYASPVISENILNSKTFNSINLHGHTNFLNNLSSHYNQNNYNTNPIRR